MEESNIKREVTIRRKKGYYNEKWFEFSQKIQCRDNYQCLKYKKYRKNKNPAQLQKLDGIFYDNSFITKKIIQLQNETGEYCQNYLVF